MGAFLAKSEGQVELKTGAYRELNLPGNSVIKLFCCRLHHLFAVEYKMGGKIAGYNDIDWEIV
ncbi:hypothetical protein [Mechercharimyces sp. CAU 1602]|uniref:hypothetical protein n=1 Tax=Mechercharimyces sp. CAU 1602 TaxID=2973933 RepID=UPI00216116ED|nr:hypothetical protein [Mechercharimyces sp. CAU 1602]